MTRAKRDSVHRPFPMRWADNSVGPGQNRMRRCFAVGRRYSGVSRRRGRGEAVAEHDFHQLCSVRRTIACRVDYPGRLAEELRTYRRWCDQAECPRVLDSIVIESVYRAPRNAQRLPRPDVDLFPANAPS